MFISRKKLKLMEDKIEYLRTDIDNLQDRHRYVSDILFSLLKKLGYSVGYDYPTPGKYKVV